MSVDTSDQVDRLSWQDLLDGLQVQFRVLNALILRETKSRYGTHKLGFFWLFFEPMIFVGLFLSFKYVMPTAPIGGMPDEFFIITGITPFLLFRQCMQSLSSSIANARSLLAFPQVTTFDVIMSTVLLEFATIIFVFMVLVAGFSIGSEPPRIENPLLVLYGTVLLGLTGSGVGMIFASLTPIIPSVKNVSNPLFGRPLFFTSGIFFTAEMIPEPARSMILYNPMLHMVEMIRSGFFIEFESQYMDINFASMFAASVFLLGLVTHQVLRNHAIKLT